MKNTMLPAKEENGDLLTVRGQVLGPDGRPEVGAKITVFCPSYVNRIEQWESIARLTVGPTGLFELVYRKSQCDVVAGETDWWKAAMIEIEANGLAFHWTFWQLHRRVETVGDQPCARGADPRSCARSAGAASSRRRSLRPSDRRMA